MAPLWTRATGARPVATYLETRYTCAIGCGSCVFKHEIGDNYLEIISAILDSSPPMCLVCGYRMGIISATKTGGHEFSPLPLACWACTWCNISTLYPYKVLPGSDEARAERFTDHLCGKCGRPCCWYPAATPSDADGAAPGGPAAATADGPAGATPDGLSSAAPAPDGPAEATPDGPAAKRLRVARGEVLYDA